MWIIVLTLLIPLLGGALLLVDSHRQSAFPFDSRPTWTRILQCLGGLSITVGNVLLLFSGSDLLNSPEGSLLRFALLAGLAGITILTGLQTFRLQQSWPSNHVDKNDTSVIDQFTPHSLMSELSACHLRSGAWVMALYPLLYVLPILGILGIAFTIISALTLSSMIQSRRALQSQLLWLLAISIRNQLPIPQELRHLAQNKGVRLQRRLQQAAGDLEDGDPLWMALQRHKLLPSATVSALRVSEGGAHFEETLRRLAVHSTNRLKVFSLTQVAEVMSQLFLMIMIGAGIVAFLMYFIIPKFKNIFEGFDVELPQATSMLIDLSDHVVSVSSVLVFWAGLVIVFLMWHALRHLVGWSSLSFPALMHWFPKRDAPEVLRALGGIVQQGGSILQHIQSLVDRPGRPDLGARYQRIAAAMSAGQPLSDALASVDVITPLQQSAIAASERAGHLEFVLFSLAETLEHREFRRGAYWAELLKPIAIVACGVFTAFIVIAMFLPLVKLLNELS